MIETIFVRDPYNYDRDQASRDSAFHTHGTCKVQQNQKEDADINTIVRRFNLTGQLPSNLKMPQYGDFIGIGSYHEAMNAVKNAEQVFMKYPWEVRKRFNHDPQEFVEFCSDPRNEAEAAKLGLIKGVEDGRVSDPTDITPKPVSGQNSDEGKTAS